MNQKEDVFKKNIIEELGLDALPEERKKELLNKMGGLIQRRVLLRVIESLSAADKQEFNQFLSQKNDNQAVYRFLLSKVPDIENITDNEIVKFKEEVLAHAASLSF